MNDLYRILPQELDALMVELGEPRYRAGQLLRALYHDFPAALVEVRALPAALREKLAAAGYGVGPGDEVRSVVSEDGETTKLLLRLGHDTLIESVLMQYPEPGKHPRSTVCVSSQAGCAMGCIFCATGQMGFERNLKAEEMVAQVVHMARRLKPRSEHVTNVVFMGMGEPLANYGETVRAARLLTDPRAFGLAQRSITISTVGILSGIDRLADQGMQVGLAISLHAPNEELRRRLVPTAGPHSVHDLVSAARRYFKKTGRRVTFEYALIDGLNDSPELARQLAGLLRGSGTHVNLIPVNPTAGGFGRPPRQRVVAFERILREGGVNCTIRAEKGSEISAACGQLRTDEDIARVDFVPLSGAAAAPARGRRQSALGPAPSPAR
ncbi:MAG: 23S rRNA (adenine(2503)-C(2))-methyltransferase RlmN [Chloroflexi bacterium]|nr:23S rRNA (adenine(2503)-C(2))-methyltransferase RlmN [Chloroflexota bacterium]